MVFLDLIPIMVVCMDPLDLGVKDSEFDSGSLGRQGMQGFWV